MIDKPLATRQGGAMNTTLLYVALGGAIGAALRYQVSLLVAFPWGTLTVNVLGAFLIGIVWHFVASKGSSFWGPFVMTGVLGGFTTFSTFSLDVLRLMEVARYAQAVGYVAASIILALAACFAGQSLMRGVG